MRMNTHKLVSLSLQKFEITARTNCLQSKAVLLYFALREDIERIYRVRSYGREVAFFIVNLGSM